MQKGFRFPRAFPWVFWQPGYSPSDKAICLQKNTANPPRMPPDRFSGRRDTFGKLCGRETDSRPLCAYKAACPSPQRMLANSQGVCKNFAYIKIILDA